VLRAGVRRGEKPRITKIAMCQDVALGRQTHYTMMTAHLQLVTRGAQLLVRIQSTRTSKAPQSKYVVSTA
jgi:hypothetical protein